MREAATIVDTLADTDPGANWIDGYVAIVFRGAMSSAAGDIPAALLDADRLSKLPNDLSGWASFFSPYLRSLVLLGESTDESMAAAVAAVEASRAVSQSAQDMAASTLGTQLYRIGRHDEAHAATRQCLESPVMMESFKIAQVTGAVRSLTALGRLEEALDVIETDFGPMLDAQHRNLRVHRLLSLIIVLHDLRELERRDHLAAISLKIATNWDPRLPPMSWPRFLATKKSSARSPNPTPPN